MGQIHDAGHETRRPARAGGLECSLIHPYRVDIGKSGRVIDAGLAVLADRRHRGTPADPELPGHCRHRSPVLSDAPADLGAGPFGQRRPRRDHRRGLGPRPLRTQRVRATPHPLDPHHRDRPPTRGQIPHPTRPPIMQFGHRPAARAAHQIGGRFDRLLQLTLILRHGQHDKAGHTQHCRCRTTLSFHLGPPSPCPEHHGS